MKDRFGRTIEYLRVSVTDRCNLRCRYCMPKDGVTFLEHKRILSFEEILQVVRAAVERGIWKVRLTGGEPLVRRDLPMLVGMLAQVPGIQDLAMTTNGQLLAEYAQVLADSGLHRVNVSLDTTNPVLYRHLTRGGEIRRVFEGIDAARRAGLTPIKLNCVVSDSSPEETARDVARFADENGLNVRFIREMDLAAGSFSLVEGGGGGDCARCNRLRLTSDGIVRPCLFSDIGFNVREIGPVQALELAVGRKPEAGRPCMHEWMGGIGG